MKQVLDEQLAISEVQPICAHCGDVCNDVRITADDLVFCCSGCQSVYEILQTNNLCDYYSFDHKAGVSMKGAMTDEYAVLDDPDIERQFVEFDSGTTRRLRFEIPAMHCASCVWLLEQLDRLNTGVLRSEVDLMRKLVRIDIDPRRTTARAVAALIASLGYRPLIRPEGAAGSSVAMRSIYVRLGVAGFAAGNVMMFSIARYVAGPDGMMPSLRLVFDVLSILLSIPVLVFSASSWWRSAWGALRQRRLNLDVPVALGILVLFVRSVVDILMGTSEGFLDSFTGLVFFLLIGRLFQQKAFDAVSFDRTYRSFFPLSVRVSKGEHEESVRVDNVHVGDTIVIRNGEVIPCDAMLVSSGGYIDYSFVTGESVPVECVEGRIVYAGGRVVGGRLRMTVTKAVSNGYLASLWNNADASVRRTSLLDLADSFGAWFTIGAVGIAGIGGLLWLPDISMALTALSAVLIIACPCALTLAAPATLGTAMGLLGRRGIFVKNVGVLLDIAKTNAMVFDKTGTLTESEHSLSWVGPEIGNELRGSISAVAMQSTHPVSRSVERLFGASLQTVTDVEEHVGAGIRGIVNGRVIAIGSASFAGSRNAYVEVAASVAVDGRPIGSFRIVPQLRDGIDTLVGALRRDHDVYLVSGDSSRDALAFEPVFGAARMRFNASPHDKIDVLEQLARQGRHTVMIGDGLNDAGAMRAAHVGIAVTEGTATLVPACDVIMGGETLQDMANLIAYARNLRSLIWFSLVFSMVYNVIGVALAITGTLSPVTVAIMMPLSSLIVTAVSVVGARWYGRRSQWVS